MTTLTPREGLQIVVAKVPEDAESLYIPIGQNGLWYKINGNPFFNIKLPLGYSYEILLDTANASEEQWKEVVSYFTDYEVMRSGYKNYALWAHEYDLFKTATESGHSFLRAHNLEGRYIILKQEKLEI
jgi:hypothetical protein